MSAMGPMSQGQEAVKWVLQVVDIISSPVRTSVLALVGLDKQLGLSITQLGRFEKALYVSSLAIKGLAAASGPIGGAIVSLTGGLMKAAESLGSMLASVGEVAFGNVAYREDTVVGLKAIFGSMIKDERQAGEAANQLFDHAMQAALKTKFETKDIVDIYSKLMTAGFKVNQLDTLTSAISNVSTAFGLNAGQRFLASMRTMQSTGRVQWGTFRQAGLASGGFAIKEAAGLLGLDTNKSTSELTKLLQKKMRDGVDASVGIKAYMMRIKSFFDPNGQLGDYAVKQSETLSGIYSNFKEAVTNLFMSRSFADLPALAGLKKTMLNITALFKDSKDGANQFGALLNRVADDLLSVFDIGPESAKGLFDTILTVGNYLEQNVIRPFTLWLKGTVGPGIMKILGTEGGVIGALKDAATEIGRLLGLGMFEGFKAAMSGGVGNAMGKPQGKTWNFFSKEYWKGNGGVSQWNANGFAWGDIFGKAKPVAPLSSNEDWGTGPRAPNISAVRPVGTNVAGALKEGLNEGLGIHSPSTVGKKIGYNLGNSIRNGTKEGLGMNGGGRVDGMGAGITFTGPVYVTLAPANGTDAAMEKEMSMALLRLVRRASRSPGADVLGAPIGRSGSPQ